MNINAKQRAAFRKNTKAKRILLSKISGSSP